ncbi:membrane protein YfhO [Singulisphaera sp. GP187]|uniref:YfhO family protein n=1 Tax=Singulisphaera sp. GP187 TaxID=1882752 RepID=UPI0009288EAD|nr:YfhO family protein [Singulisphaera sp. GP187]SIO61045.1 membrane protein YfhO [Singulisphaera sp. GP187]
MTPTSLDDVSTWHPERRPWGRADVLALLVWTLAVAGYFWDAVTLQKALFYFDITEINFPYRDFLARELWAGRFSRWCPGLYCGFPLYSESQAGYLHPLKYFLYPWLPTWQAFNLDTILSIWLTGVGTYGWLRRHVGASGALAGAGVFGLGGYVWAHLIHTSMINSLASVPLIIWALEIAWERGRWWPIVLGALALACQVFAGHMQDTILTSELIVLYAGYRAVTDRSRRSRFAALGMALVLIALAGTIAAVQGLPSKELHSRSPRAGGLTWEELTYGSWHPELVPTLILRETYGTFARDTDWMDGFYPYHEMNAYLGAIALALAVVGAAASRDRWVAFWIILAGLGGILMLGRFTFLFDFAHRIPIIGSGRIPVRYHLWVSLAVAALTAVGVDRLSRPGTVRLRPALLTIGILVLVSIPILITIYTPVWSQSARWRYPYHLARFRWLGEELRFAALRTAILAFTAWAVAASALRSSSPLLRTRLVAILPVLILADLLGAHYSDVPTITPRYWTDPPESARQLKADPDFVRLIGVAKRASNEPGFASKPVDFLTARDTLDWSLPPVWGLASARGETPMLPRRLVEFSDHVLPREGRFDLQAVTHLVTSMPNIEVWGKGTPAGSAFINRNPNALPRTRLMGRPIYVESETAAIAALDRFKPALRDRPVIEDPTRPLPVDAQVSGTATIARELPELVEVRTESNGPAYLILADTFDPGWSATIDGREVPIRAAYVAFRAVFVPAGAHTVLFRYQPAGFRLGLTITGLGLLAGVALLVWKRSLTLDPEHIDLAWPRAWPIAGMAGLLLIVLLSAFEFDRSYRPVIHPRWARSFHRFTWGAGIEAINPPRGKNEPPQRFGAPQP